MRLSPESPCVTPRGMKKYLFGAFFGVVLISGIGFVTYLGVQPRPVQKIKPSTFANTTVVVNSILISLRPELMQYSVVLWGLDAENADQRQVLRDFLNQVQDPAEAFSVIVIDRHLEDLAPEIKTWPGDRIDAKEEVDRLAASLQMFQEKKARTLVILPTGFAAALLEESPARKLRDRGIMTANLLFASFPRNREQEDRMEIPCNVGGHDNTGTSVLGCQIVSTARLFYRKHFQSGEMVGLLNQISRNDFLFLLTREP